MDTHGARNWRTFRRRLGIAVLSCAAAVLLSWWYYPSWIKWRHVEAEWDGHPGLVNAIAFSRDGSLLATAGSDGTIVIWDNTGRRMKTLTAHEGGVQSIAFAPDGITLASGGEDGIIKLWDITEMQMHSSIRGHDERVLTVAFTPRGDILATEGDGVSGIKLWDTSPLEFRAELALPVAFSGFSGISLSPDGRFLATANFYDDYPMLWDASTGEEVAKLTGDYTGFKYTSIAFSPDGLTLATGTRRGQIITWDVNERRQKLQWQAYRTALGGGLGFLPNGNVLVTAAPPSGIGGVFPSEISLWSLPDQRQLLRLPMDRRLTSITQPEPHTVLCIAISPDGRTVATGHWNGVLRLWKLPRSVTQR